MIVPVLVGPTGSGKTAIALELARRMSADVISADSRQIYQQLLAGTAKPEGKWVRDGRHPLREYYDVEGVPHHLVDFLEPTETYNAGLFARRAEEILQALSEAGRPAILVGGTGLYLRALIDGLAPLPSQDKALRRRLEERADKEGRASLHEELARVDPAAAEKIPPNNLARVIRALEVFQLTGEPISRWQKERTVASSRSFQWFGLRWPKDALEERLKDRCRSMVPGMLEETSVLLRGGVPKTAPAFQALGYRGAVDCVEGRLPREEFQKAFFQDTRLYVKRQLTWFRADKRIRWLDVEQPLQPALLAESILRDK